LGIQKRLFTGFNYSGIGMFLLGIFLPILLEQFMMLNPIIRWGITILGVLIGVIFIVIGQLRIKQESSFSQDNSLVLLALLDEVYQRLKTITRLTIRKLRANEWEDVTSAYPYFMGLADLDIDAAIEEIMLRNVYFLTTGRPMTIVEESTRLAERIKQSSLFTRNPEHIAKDASILLEEKVPYLKKKLDHDRTYKKLIKRVERERDKYPSEAITNAIDEYMGHSVKINAAWILSTYDLDHMGVIEGIAGRRIPMKFKIMLMGLPGRMDEEMRKYRTKVAVAILEYHKENTI
jgi:hypothetical protein